MQAVRAGRQAQAAGDTRTGTSQKCVPGPGTRRPSSATDTVARGRGGAGKATGGGPEQGAINERRAPPPAPAPGSLPRPAIACPSDLGLTIGVASPSPSRAAVPGPARPAGQPDCRSRARACSSLCCGDRNLDVRQSGWFADKPKQRPGNVTRRCLRSLASCKTRSVTATYSYMCRACFADFGNHM